MDFELSADQLALRDAARDLLDAAASSERVRSVVDDPDATHDDKLRQQAVEQGWFALELPEDDGGLGLGFVEVAVLAEELGRHVAPVPWLGGAVALPLLREAGGDAGALADAVVAGEATAALAWGDEVTVDAPVADLAVAGTGDAARVLRLDGMDVPAQPAMDRTRTVGWLPTDAPAVAELGADVARLLLDRGATAYAAELLGCAERMLDVAVEYAKVREQFGTVIGSFQAVKHRLADAFVDVEGMRSAAYYAAWAVSTDAPDRSLAASTAKSWCSDAALRVIGSALQVHGGVGFTWEHDLHLFLKRAQLDARQLGTAAVHRRRLAGLLKDRVAAGADLW